MRRLAAALVVPAAAAALALAAPVSAAPLAAASGTGWSRLIANSAVKLDYPRSEHASKRAKTPAKRTRRGRRTGRIVGRPAMTASVSASWWGPVVGAPGTAAAPSPSPPGSPAGPAPVVPAPTVTPTPTPAGPDVPDLPGTDPHSVSVASTEFAFALSQSHVKAGRVRIQFDNSRAQDPHSLAAHGTDLAIGETAPRKVVTVSYDFAPGTYTLYCPIAGHEDLGMKARLTVDP